MVDSHWTFEGFNDIERLDSEIKPLSVMDEKGDPMDYYTSIEQFPATLSAEELAKALNVSMSTSYRLLHSKGFPVVTIGKRKMVTKHDLLKWMSKQVTLALS